MNQKEIDISKNLQAIAQQIGAQLKEITGQEIGFFLLVGNTEAGGRTNYVSNMDRAQSVEVMLDLLDRWMAGMQDIPTHKVS